jgi:hypothetical protein
MTLTMSSTADLRSDERLLSSWEVSRVGSQLEVSVILIVAVAFGRSGCVFWGDVYFLFVAIREQGQCLLLRELNDAGK